MKRYIIDGKTHDRLPDPVRGCSPMTEERFVSMGGVISDDGEPSPFEAACAMFRTLCAEIGEFIGDPDFRGGFDEYAVFASSESYVRNPVRGNALAIRWSALNELCKYEGVRAGYDQPGWWYACWDQAEAEE